MTRLFIFQKKIFLLFHKCWGKNLRPLFLRFVQDFSLWDAKCVYSIGSLHVKYVVCLFVRMANTRNWRICQEHLTMSIQTSYRWGSTCSSFPCSFYFFFCPYLLLVFSFTDRQAHTFSPRITRQLEESTFMFSLFFFFSGISCLHAFYTFIYNQNVSTSWVSQLVGGAVSPKKRNTRR